MRNPTQEKEPKVNNPRKTGKGKIKKLKPDSEYRLETVKKPKRRITSVWNENRGGMKSVKSVSREKKKLPGEGAVLKKKRR